MRNLLLVLIISFVAGCTTIGNKFDPKNLDLLIPEVTTIADATRLLGAPVSESAMADGSILYQWQYITAGSGAHVGILFDSEGVMVRVTHKSLI